MCIIVYHLKGTELPTKKVLERCWKGNDDGAGLLVVRDEGLRSWKGFMKWEDFWGAYRTEKLGETDEFALHFRQATSGGIEKGKCHPFPVTKDVRKLHKLKFKPREGLKKAMMHNGVLGKGEKGLSDTMVFIRDELVDVIDFLGVDDVLESVKEATTGSKLLIFHEEGVVRTGHWHKDKETGVYYSNLGYQETKVSTYCSDNYYEQYYKSKKGWAPWRGWRKKDPIPLLEMKKVLKCPQCSTEGMDRVDFSVSCIIDVATCYECGCRFDSNNIISGFNSFMWEDYLKRGELIKEKCEEGETMCEDCKGSEVNGGIMYDDTVDRYFCMTCDQYI